MSNLILNVCFFLGIFLLLISIILLRSSQRKKFDNTPQVIQLWGLKLEVSILTLVFLISVGLIATNIWFQLQRINEKIETITKEKNAAIADRDKAILDLYKATVRETEALVKLDGVKAANTLDPRKFDCNYTTKSGVTDKADILSTASKETFKIIFRNLNHDTVITSVQLFDQQGGIWSVDEEYQPLKTHTFNLSKVK